VLLVLNFILRFPDLGAIIAEYNQFEDDAGSDDAIQVAPPPLSGEIVVVRKNANLAPSRSSVLATARRPRRRHVYSCDSRIG
jgi:hypothetical protein